MANNVKKRVVVGLSGGVDSAVSAYILQQEGYEVIGLYMANWDSIANQENNYQNKFDKCDSQIEYDDAKEIAEKLGIKLYYKEFVKEYWDDVFKYFIDEYSKNRTPNPDVLCNKYIKFAAFKKYAFNEIGCDYIATGHYAKLENYKDKNKLMICKDENKDQTYFLCALTQEQLNNVIFPLANYTKSEVREIAKKIGLTVANKKDSTGICFIGERNFRNFLQNYLPNKPGDIIDISTNKIVGQHIGTMYYTIGQRKGLNLGGQNERYFVCKKDLDKKIIYVAPDSLEEKYLFSNKLFINEFNWISEIQFNKKVYARFRHRQQLQEVNVELIEKQVIVTYNPQKNVTEGQYCVLYQDGTCLGGGIIEKIQLFKN